MTAPDPFPLTRMQLNAFLDDHESIRRIERLFQVASEINLATEELEFLMHAIGDHYT